MLRKDVLDIVEVFVGVYVKLLDFIDNFSEELVNVFVASAVNLIGIVIILFVFDVDVVDVDVVGVDVVFISIFEVFVASSIKLLKVVKVVSEELEFILISDSFAFFVVVSVLDSFFVIVSILIVSEGKVEYGIFVVIIFVLMSVAVIFVVVKELVRRSIILKRLVTK